MAYYKCLTCGFLTGTPEIHTSCKAPDWEICRCGSGAHPRHCELHPERYEQHWEELNRENDAAWDRAEKTDNLKQENKELRELLSWVRQTIHQAWHKDKIESCTINTCAAITGTLGDKE